MKDQVEKSLLFISLILSALTILYLVFVNYFRGSFVVGDWIVVSVDLAAKLIIESVLFLRNR